MGATQAGLSAFLLRRNLGEGEEDDPTEIEIKRLVPPDRIISSLSELPNLLSK